MAEKNVTPPAGDSVEDNMDEVTIRDYSNPQNTPARGV